jgi:DNA polymerase-3 subunit gamma/tau
MSYIALYRKWRPDTFDSVVEQEHVVKTLKNAVRNDKIAHAYLFSGTRGTGKTTMAKLLARAINCDANTDGNPCNKCDKCLGILDGSILDIIEIDAASNNSVDNIRDIRDEVIYTPAVTRFKVYIIDEVHMLSTGAFNALLKTLEEPPSHVVFILATTEPHKLPATILSRCQKYDFKRISPDGIYKRLELIINDNNLSFDKRALRLIARYSKGALRDGISLLDQCMSMGKDNLSLEDIKQMAGVYDDDIFFNLLFAIKNQDIQSIISLVDEINNAGKDLYHFLQSYIEFLRNILIFLSTGELDDTLYTDEDNDSLKKIKSGFKAEELIYYIKEISNSETTIKWSDSNKVLIEVLFIRIAMGYSKFNENYNEKLESLERRFETFEQKLNNPEIHNIPVTKSTTGKTLEPKKPGTIDNTEIKNEKEKPVETLKEENIPEQKQETEDIKDIWEEFLMDIKAGGKMVLYSNIINFEPVLEGNVLFLSQSKKNDFAVKAVTNQENSKYIETSMSERLGRSIKIKIRTEESRNEGDRYIDNLSKLSRELNIDIEIDE